MVSETLRKLSCKNADPGGSAPVTIGFLGDSVTHGCFEVWPAVSENGEEGIEVVFDQEQGYPALFRKLLLTLYPRAQINLVNAGVNGDSAPRGLARLDRDLLPYHPDLTVVCYGLNDCCQGVDKIGAYHNALLSILRRLKDAGSEAILMTPQPVCTRVHSQLRGDGLRNGARTLAAIFADGVFDRYMQAARAAAAEAGVPLCDVYAKWMAMHQNGVDITDLLANYLNHPTRAMHHLFAWSLLDTVFGN